MSTMMMAAGFNDENILESRREVLRYTFQLDAAYLFSSSRRASIDINAVDFTPQRQKITGMRTKLKDFKSVRAVGDVIATVHTLLAR